jgi:glycosyltransferase involved in cell wall biosynthesis
VKIVCCCATEDRPEFIPWLVWNFQKQTHADKELLIIDTGETAWSRVGLEGIPGIKVIHREHGMRLPTKANLAVGLADGDAIAFMDDDDWQAPNRLELLAGKLTPGVDMVGTHCGAWINLRKRVIVEHRSPMMIFNSCLVRANAAKSVQFDESILKTSDTKWMRELLAKSKSMMIPDRLHAWVCHESNICNPVDSRRWDKARDVQDVLGSETTYALRSISERLENRNVHTV